MDFKVLNIFYLICIFLVVAQGSYGVSVLRDIQNITGPRLLWVTLLEVRQDGLWGSFPTAANM